MKARKRQLPVSRLDDPDMQAAPAAMERAVRRAHRVAHQHGTGVLVVENGKMVEIEPDLKLVEDNQRRDPALGDSEQQDATRGLSAGAGVQVAE